MEEVRIQKQDRSVSFRVATDAGEFIVFDMSLSSPTRNRTLYSGKSSVRLGQPQKRFWVKSQSLMNS